MLSTVFQSILHRPRRLEHDKPVGAYHFHLWSVKRTQEAGMYPVRVDNTLCRYISSPPDSNDATESPIFLQSYPFTKHTHSVRREVRFSLLNPSLLPFLVQARSLLHTGGFLTK
jgi:hypothetical protein